jgi:hypothetical protein
LAEDKVMAGVLELPAEMPRDDWASEVQLEVAQVLGLAPDEVNFDFEADPVSQGLLTRVNWVGCDQVHILALKDAVRRAASELADPGSSPDTARTIMDRRGPLGRLSLTTLLPADTASLAVTDHTGGHRRLVLKRRDGRVEATMDSDGKPRWGITFARDGSYSASGNATPPSVQLIESGQGTSDFAAFEALFTAIDLAGRRDWLIELMRPLLPGLKDLRILVPDGRATVFVEDGVGRWPLAVAGDGFKRLFVMAARLMEADVPLTLLEEPETYLHVGALKQVSKLFWQATKPAPDGLGRQLIITTHSLEYLDAQFLDATDDELARAAVVRLSLTDGHLKSVTIPGPTVRELRADIGEDLRR